MELMTQELDQKSIDFLVDKKLAGMEAEYEMYKKYDNPDYKGAEHPVDQKLQENNIELVEEDKTGQAEEVVNAEEDDEFQDYQGYEKMDENSEGSEEKVNFDEVEHIDPFSKPLDVDFIKQCMAEIQLPTPPWAQSAAGWESRFKEMKQL